MISNTQDLFRKSIFFSPSRWLDLQQVMADLDVHSPSLAIAALITQHKNKQGAVNAQPISHHSSR